MTKEEAKKLLSNTKVYVNGHTCPIIKKLSEIGFINNGWPSTGDEFIYIHKNEPYTYGISLHIFFNHEYREIAMSDILDIQIDPGFKDGDVLANKYGNPFIFNGVYDSDGDLKIRLGLTESGVLTTDITGAVLKLGVHFATEEESAKLFKALHDAGNRWNAEKKCVEDLPKEFNPFDRVLVRDSDTDDWKCDFYSHKDNDNYICVGESYWQCIPYEGNEHLVGKK